MTVWNLLSQAMHLRCSLKRIGRSVLCALLLIMMSGCRKTDQKLFTKGEWIQELTIRSGIQINTDQSYEQVAISYGIISEDVAYDPSSLLTKEWMAYTLVNLTRLDDPYDKQIKDLNDSAFPYEVVRSIPLISLDNGYFHPKETVGKEEALSILDEAIEMINTKVIAETKTEVAWNDGLNIIELSDPVSFNEDGTVSYDKQFRDGDLIVYPDEDGNRTCAAVVESEGRFKLEEADLLSLSDSIHLSGSQEIDFSNAQIIDGNNDVIVDASDDVTQNMAIHNYTSSFTLQDWKVTLTATSLGLKAEASKELPNGSKAFANVRLSGLKCDYQWLSEKKSLKEVYFRLSFNSEENFGVRHTSYKKLYGDFSRIDPSDFVSSVKNFFQDADHCVQKTLTLATVNVPIPNVPGLTLQVRVDMNIYVSGRIEFTMHQSHILGCEIHNGTTRLIQDMNPTHTEDIRANAKLTSALRFGLKMTGFELCNAALNAGIETSVSTDLHLYHPDGSHTVEASDLPVDVADELSDGNPNVFVCADLDAHFIGEVDLNSSSSVLGKLGLSRNIPIFTSKNASLLPDGMKHLENFHFVKECTRKQGTAVIENNAPAVTGKITLDRYAYAINVNGYRTIVVKGMPEGYDADELIFETSNSEVAIVSENGRVTGRSPGSAEITVSSEDGKHKAYVSILVKTP